tara:strand:- start:5734 stop:7371 length:1638 start_codon:yes stop_codon:yes gene_type:complete
MAALFEARASAAALGHYPTLRIQTQNLHDALSASIAAVENLAEDWRNELRRDLAVANEFRASDSALFAYRTIAPALVRNVHRTADFLLEETHPTPAVDLDLVGSTVPSFSDFVRLGAATRAFLDAVVQTAYQLATFDGAQLNYKFLQSLLSFAAVAPASLHSNIVSDEMQAALDAYVALSGKERKNSAFTKASHEQFPQRLAVAALAAGLPDRRRRNLELLFGFCSDFVHSGYVSVLALGSETPGFVLGGPGDAFVPKAENFAELKQRLLAECAGAYADLLLLVLRQAIDRTLSTHMPVKWVEALDEARTQVADTRHILHRQLIEPVREGLPGSEEVIHIACICGSMVRLEPPHREWDRFCHDCGSRFALFEVDEGVDYVVSSSGVGDVNGGDAPKIADLDPAARDKLGRIAARHAPDDVDDEIAFALIRDLQHCDEATLEVPSLVTSAPGEMERSNCSLMAFVASKAIERSATVRVTCNCGSAADYETASGTYVAHCRGCGARIGLLGVTGDGAFVGIQNPDGSPGKAPIQGRNRFEEPGVAVD